jgi:hypothetical protein
MRALLLLLLLSCSSAPAIPASTSSPATTKSKEEVTQLVQHVAPMLLKTFRPRMDFVSEITIVQERERHFVVTIEIDYQSFLKQNGRTARLTFELDPYGNVSLCKLQDPVRKASEISCSQLETKLSQLFKPSF